MNPSPPEAKKAFATTLYVLDGDNSSPFVKRIFVTFSPFGLFASHAY